MLRTSVALLLVGCMLTAFSASEALAQSGTRGNVRRAAPSGLPSRVGGARSKAVPTRARPTGMMNSANAARMSGAMRSAGSGSRPTTGLTPRSSLGATRSSLPSRSYLGAPSSTGLVRPGNAPSRTPSRSSRGSSPTSAYAGKKATVPAGYRQWTDASGKYHIQGKLVAERDGVVWIRRLDGKLARLGVDQLSEADQTFLTTL